MIICTKYYRQIEINIKIDSATIDRVQEVK